MIQKILKIYSDGGARGNPGPSAAAFVVVEDGKVVDKQTKFLGEKTNNEAEYSGVLMALKWVVDNREKLNEKRILFFLDSELVVKQIIGAYKTKSKNLKPLILKVRSLKNMSKIKINFFSVDREKNRLADRLVNKVLDEKKTGFT